jgi:hypothetical protein
MAEVMREAVEHRCDHLVQVYRDHAELADSVASYFVAGFEAGEPALAVVMAAHWPSIRERLEKRGFAAEELEASGLLTRRDAEETLDALFENGALSARRFKDVIGGVLDLAESVAPGKPVRAFGEMVDVLARRGEVVNADALEGLWNDLLAKRRFSLLCGYQVDLFDVEAHVSLLPQVYRTHTHVLPPQHIELLEIAVERALTEVLGDDAQKVYANVERHRSTAPRAHLALRWVSANMPRTAEQVLAAARTHYADVAA